MAEKLISLGSISPINVYGANDEYLTKVAELYPNIKLIARGNQLKVLGTENDILPFEHNFSKVLIHIERYGSISERGMLSFFTHTQEPSVEETIKDSSVIVYGANGNVIKARTENQLKLVEAVIKNDMVFAVGPAGSGKTYTAVALAVKALKNKEVKKIILTRPAVEAGENLGFLPGDLKEKLDPYLQPLYDALRDMIVPDKLKQYIENEIIQIAPLAFMRGRTLDNAFVILDEAQNATQNQLKMFLTRMGRSAKFIITGDVTQIDLPKNQPSGLIEGLQLLEKIEGVAIIRLTGQDIVRHPLVKRIIEAYDEKESKK